MNAGKVDVAAWFLRVLAWDGLLPAGLWSAPWVVGFLFPGRRGAIELTAVALPVVAFLVRLRSGLAHIRSNHCGRWVRAAQSVAFVAGILFLALMDCFVILLALMPQMQFTAEDWPALAIPAAIYLSLMGGAMYPGRTPRGDDEWPAGYGFPEF